jgi:serine protease Do
MKARRSNVVFTIVLVFAAVVFGMVIAGGSQITTPGFSAPAPTPPQTVVQAQGFPNFADLAEAVLPAVASVRVITIQTSDSGGRSPFEFFFSDPRQQQSPDRPREFRSDGAGSGFLISSDGWLVTNNHVIDGATKVEVMIEGKVYEATVRGADESTDLAVLKVDSEKEFKYLAFGDSNKLRVGAWVMAIGNPLALAQSVTVGVVSAKGRSLGLQRDTSFENYIQTDAAINRGNSGGPLVNLAGEVIGISTAMNFGAENIGFAVPVNTLVGIVDQLRTEGRVRRGYLGVNITNLDDDAAEAFGVDSTRGALVSQVVAGGPADEAGLRNGDIIVKVDDEEVEDTRGLIDYVAAKPPGDSVEIRLIRNGRTIDKRITLGERNLDRADVREAEKEDDELSWLGLQYQTLTPRLRQMHGIDDGVRGVWVTDVAVSSPLVDEGVAPGNVITEINGEEIDDEKGFQEMINSTESGEFLRFYVRQFSRRGSNAFFAIVRVP